MAEGIVYLDVDDEITSAASRIRSAAGTRVALVVPYGSRIATSRMNFRLLSREAVVSNKRLSIVSGDAASRSLAASAGLPVFGSVGEYEEAARAPRDTSGEGEAGAPPPAAAAPPASPDSAAAAAAASAGALAASATVAATGPVAGSGDATPPASDAPSASPVGKGRKSQRPKRPVADDATTVVPTVTATTLSPHPSAPPVQPPPYRPPVRERERLLDERDDGAAIGRTPLIGGRVRTPILAAVAVAALALVVVAVAGYLFLPSATVALTPRREPIGPIQLTISADPTATAVDPVAGVVPAVRLDVPVQAARTFPTTGKHVEASPARGTVTFSNYDFTSQNTIVSGSVVSTEGGIRFRTLATVTLPPATLIIPTVVPSRRSVAVEAVADGPEGNVPANTIRVVPRGENPEALRVNNPDPTEGGVKTETPEVSKAEVDKAVAAVQADLEAAFTAAIAAGGGAPPDTTLFPETAALGPATPEVDPATLVGQPVESFDIGLSATGTVIAVDPSPIESIAASRLDDRVEANHRLVEGSVDIAVGEGSVGEDGQITFEATARAMRVAIVDAVQLRTLVKGLTPAEAKTALAPFGDAVVTLWPDWVTTITGVDARLTVTVDEDGAAVPSPSGSPRPSPSRTPAGSPPPSAGDAASSAP
ncbi:MAG TPA: hypothetical protein VFK35_02445 [Candidatus Limnocylindrales bacterium]|nr:hypothetical protein [Candidatus Limnocylindrales bacterium]